MNSVCGDVSNGTCCRNTALASTSVKSVHFVRGARDVDFGGIWYPEYGRYGRRKINLSRNMVLDMHINNSYLYASKATTEKQSQVKQIRCLTVNRLTFDLGLFVSSRFVCVFVSLVFMYVSSCCLLCFLGRYHWIRCIDATSNTLSLKLEHLKIETSENRTSENGTS